MEIITGDLFSVFNEKLCINSTRLSPQSMNFDGFYNLNGILLLFAWQYSIKLEHFFVVTNYINRMSYKSFQKFSHL